MRLISLTAVDCIVQSRNVYWDEARDVGESVVADSEQAQLMSAEVEFPEAVDFVLLTVFQALQESVPISGFNGNPRIYVERLRTPAGSKITVSVVAGQSYRRVKPRTQLV